MNESPEAGKNAPAASRPEETGIPSVPPDARKQQDTPAPQHPNAAPPEAEGGRQADKEPGATPPLPLLKNDDEEEGAPQPASASEKPKPKRPWPRFLFGFMLLVLLACGGAGWLAYDFLNSPGTDPAVAPAQNVEVTVNPGTTFRTLTPELVRLGAVRNADKFILLLRWMSYRDIPHALKPGRFRLNTGWTPQQVIDQLVNGSPLLDRVTIPEGLAWWEVGKRLEKARMVRFEDFAKLVHDPAFLRHWGIPFDSAEGFLFPDTYLIMRPLELNETTAKSVVGRLIDNFWRRTAPLWPGGKRPGPSGRDGVRRLVTLASIVERETAVPSERPRVAGVYANRLRLNMLLQADPTTAYGLGEGFDGNLRRRHLDDESNPYNTYKRPGLPPGPICSPGLACLKAAANPEKHDYIYFVARGEDGSHVFSTNLATHNRAVREYWAKRRGK